MFETCVSQIVKVVLVNETVNTEFFNGTLFVSPISETQARSVFHRLTKTFGLGKVQVSVVGDDEFAYDFV
jgi:hypothetical protein